jgi:hypothetical protein
VIIGAQIQTSCLPNIQPHSNKGEGVVRVETNGEDLGSTQRHTEGLLQLERNAAPSILPEALPQRNREITLSADSFNSSRKLQDSA